MLCVRCAGHPGCRGGPPVRCSDLRGQAWFPLVRRWANPGSGRGELPSCSCWGRHNEGPQAGWLSRQKPVCSQPRGQESRGRGGGRVGFPRGLSPWRVGGHLLPVSSRGRLSVRVCVLVSSPEDAGHGDQGPPSMASWNLMPPFTTVSKSRCVPSSWG